MGIDLAAMWGDAKQAASQGMSDLLTQGGNAGLGYLEGQAIAVIQQDQAQKQKALGDFVTAKLNQPASPGSFGSYLQGMVSQPIIKQYGVYILGGAVILIFLGVYMKH